MQKLMTELGQHDIVRGQKNYWKALDDLNDPSSVVAVQTQILDPEPDDFTRQDRPIMLVKDKNGTVVDVKP